MPMSEETNELTTSTVQLAKRLGISRVSYNSFRKLPGAPKPKGGKHNVAAWKEFILSNGLNQRGREFKDAGELQREKLEKQNELLQIEIDTKRGDLLPRDEVQREVTRMIAQFKSVLYTKLESEAPPVLEGQTAADIQLHLRETIGEACEQLHEGKWASHTLNK